MWRLKQFIPKDHCSLLGKTVEIGALKLQIRSMIAQGGFSSVYFAKDSHTGKHYALKHIICNDGESLDLAKKEITVMKSLAGHPNVVTLHANVILDTGRTKECFIAMDHCEKTLGNFLEGRDASGFDEKHLLLTFRDVCNAVHALHCQSPPVAHRDLKTENVLLGPDGTWKLCDFGSTSTNHRRHDRLEEMGIEEDVIRKHTTPAYRAPEMWDLYRREFICEKVDIWALGCLLYRMAYTKPAFDGDSKLQILNGNYHIPDSPKYTPDFTNLIKDMLQSGPDARPDILQIWNRVNNLLPSDKRKSAPDKPPSLSTSDSVLHKDSFDSALISGWTPKTYEDDKAAENNSAWNEDGGKSAGSFWSSSFSKETQSEWNSLSNVGMKKLSSMKLSSPPQTENLSLKSEQTGTPHDIGKNGVEHHVTRENKTRAWGRNDDELLEHGPGFQESESAGFSRFNCIEKCPASERWNSSHSRNSAEGLKLSPTYAGCVNPNTSEVGSDERERLKIALEEVSKERAETLAKFKQLSALCRSQRQEIQDLKSSLAAISSCSIVSTPKQAQEAPKLAPVNFMKQIDPQQKQLPVEVWQGFEEGIDEQKRSVTNIEGLSPLLLPKSPASIASTGKALNTSESSISAVHTRFPNQSKNGSQGNVLSRSTDGRHPRHQHIRSASVSGGENWDIGGGTFVAKDSMSQDSIKLENKGLLDGNMSMKGWNANASRNGATSVRRVASKLHQPAGWAAF